MSYDVCNTNLSISDHYKVVKKPASVVNSVSVSPLLITQIFLVSELFELSEDLFFVLAINSLLNKLTLLYLECNFD